MAKSNREIFQTLILGYNQKAVKLINTKKGVRYMHHSRGGRFLPLAKKKFEELDLKVIPVFQELPGLGWMQINETI